MTLFFNLNLLENKTQCDPIKLVEQLRLHFIRKSIPKNQYTKIKPIFNLKGNSFLINASSFFADNNKLTDSTTFLHTDKMYLIDKSQQIRGVYNATNMDDISRVLTDIKALK